MSETEGIGLERHRTPACRPRARPRSVWQRASPTFDYEIEDDDEDEKLSTGHFRHFSGISGLGNTNMIETGWSSITVINILIGIILLTLGRKLFWLFVGFIGFAVGFHYAASVWNLQSQLFLIGLAVLTGIIGAVVAVFFQKIAVGLAGFAGGGYITLNLINLLGVRMDQLIWLPYLIGGIIGMLLLFFIFDWALILISSLAGASMIIQALSLNPRMEFGLYLALVTLGIVIQTVLYRKSPSPKEKN